jgi:anthranilate synthase component 1
VKGRRIIHRNVPECALAPALAYGRLTRVRPGPALLFESARLDGFGRRRSFVCLGALAHLRAVDGAVTISLDGSPERRTTATPLDAARGLLAYYRPTDDDVAQAPHLGLFGAAAFEFVQYLERVPTVSRGDDPMPDLHLIVPETVVAFDHASGEVTVSTIGDAAGTVRDDADVLFVLRSERGTTDQPPIADGTALDARSSGSPNFVSSIGQAVRAVREGEALQVVLSRPLAIDSEDDPIEVYRTLCAINPSPYMFILELGWGALIGSSPEMLVRLDGRRAIVRPLAGTAPRAAMDVDDARLASSLRRSPKDRAEHIMLVDLGRNDLARVCVPGSVRVAPFMDIERYSHVMHLVSQVEGELADSRDAFDLFGAAFPAGTVSGAPKVRAIELIAELERERRGFYAGAILRAGFDGDIDSCITLRSMHAYNGAYHLRAGAGVVAASDPHAEDAECGQKLGACIAALRLARAGVPA